MKNLFYYFFVLYVLLCFSCGQSTSDSGNSTNENSVEEGSSTTDLFEGAIEYKISSMGELKGSILLKGDNLKFFIKDIEYQAKLKGDKRKYAVSSGQIIAEVKYKEDAFKVRTESGELLWKIKLYDDKVKISNNEENLNPYEIKMGESANVKLKKNDVEIGKIKLKGDDGQLEITSETTSFIVNSNKLSLAFAVLLIDEIPDNQKYIIMAELLAKGK